MSTVLTILILFSLSTVIFTTNIYVSKEIRFPTILCLPFIDPTHKILMIKIITWFTVITQVITSISIVIMNMLFFKKVQKSRQLHTNMQSHSSDTALIVQLITIAISNILCWFSTNTVYIITMFVPKIPC